MYTEEYRAEYLRIREQVQNGERQMDEETIKEIIECMPNYYVGIKVVSQTGTCLGGHKVGEEWLMKGKDELWKTPAGICIFAFDAIYSQIQTLMFGGTFPWGYEPDVVRCACPDSYNPVVFELTRLKEV